MQKRKNTSRLDNFFEESGRWLDAYIASFESDQEDVQKAIAIKKEHTHRVTALCAELAAHLELCAYDTLIAKLLGRLHDIGRFHQYSKYHTFSDAASENHAALSVRLLPSIKGWNEIDEKTQDIFRFAIGNHNAKEISLTDDRRQLFFARLIRDCDKIDIYRVLQPYLTPPDESICGQQFIETLENGGQGDYRQMQSMNDHKVVRLLWAYDLNFSWSAQKIDQAGYIEEIIASLPKSQLYARGIKHLRNHLAKMAAKTDVRPNFPEPTS